MDSQTLTIIVAALGSGALGSLVTGLFGKRKSSADADATIAETATKTAQNLINEYQERSEARQKQHDADVEFLKSEISALRDENSELRASSRETENEVRLQSRVLENLNAQVLKYRLIISVFSMQLVQMGQQPIIDPDDIDGISVSDLQDIAASMNSIQKRRESASG